MGLLNVHKHVSEGIAIGGTLLLTLLKGYTVLR